MIAWGYRIEQTLSSGPHCRVLRARPLDDERRVIIKHWPAATPRAVLEAALNEQRLLATLHLPGVIRLRDSHAVEDGLISVFDDTASVPLRQSIASPPPPWADWLAPAIALAELLGRLHDAGVIHKQITPDHLLIHPERGEPTLIDFTQASRLGREEAEAPRPMALESPYLAPEQTGRIHRSIDYRSDYYGLGATLYEVLTGQTPFAGEAGAALTHSQIAKSPIPAGRLRPALPEMVSRLIDKLLAKDASERYQSSAGLVHDLRHCQRSVLELGYVPSFRLGREDRSPHFRLPHRLYGRREPLGALRSALAHSAEGRGGVVLIEGAAGVGKSSLVQELRRDITIGGGRLIGGKFEQFRRNRPYAAISQALRELVRSLLTEPDALLTQWRHAIAEALGPHAALMGKLVPELGAIVPVTEKAALADAVPPLVDDHERFPRAVMALLRVFSEQRGPLVVFLDDLHWADPASLALFDTLAGRPAVPRLLLIGSYRGDEVTAGSPLSRSLERLRARRGEQLRAKSQGPLELTLGALSQDEIRLLLADTLHHTPAQCTALAAACHRKTRGNPFFLKQFLSSLHDEGVFHFSNQRWQWQQADIDNRDISDNVAKLMAQRLERLPPASREVLIDGACLGGSFTLGLLSMITGSAPQALADRLAPALAEGMIVPLDRGPTAPIAKAPIAKAPLPASAPPAPLTPVAPGWPTPSPRYRFSHDRIQQAACAPLDATMLADRHLAIARRLIRGLPAEALDSRLFDVVDHYNLGRGRLSDGDERLTLAGHNLQAGLRARQAAAFDTGLDYLATGLSLLGADAWSRHYDLTLALHINAAEVAGVLGQDERSEALCAAIEANARSLLDRGRVYRLRILAEVAHNRFDAALKESLTLLAGLGVTMPKAPSPQRRWMALWRTRRRLARYGEREWLALPAMTDPGRLAAMPILESMFGAVKLSDPRLRPLVAARQIDLILRHGRCPGVSQALAGYAGVLCGDLRHIAEGYRLGRLALALEARDGQTLSRYRTPIVHNIYVRHHREPLATCCADLVTLGHRAIDIGDREWGAYALAAHIQYRLPLAVDLARTRRELAEQAQTLERLGQQQSVEYSREALIWLDALTGNAADPGAVSDAVSDADPDIAPDIAPDAAPDTARSGASHQTARCLHYLYRAQLALVFDEPERAVAHIERAYGLRDSVRGTFTMPTLLMFRALALLRRSSARPDFRERLAHHRRLVVLRRLARECPANHRHRVSLIRAEWQRRCARHTRAMAHYDDAIRHAESHGFHFEAAMARQFAADFYRHWNKIEIAQTFLRAAYLGYRALGAEAKLTQMRRRHEQDPALASILGADLDAAPAAGDARRPWREATSAAVGAPPGEELASVIDASQAISDEIVLERLLERLMPLALQNAGAQRGALILSHGQSLIIEASAHLVDDGATPQASPIRVRTEPQHLADAFDQLATSIVRYVARTREQVVLDDALEHPLFQQDRYLWQHHPKSLLCIPVLYHSDLTAVLYLEHRDSRHVFNRERLETLRILATQAAISIENAKLYQRLKRSELEYRSLFENASEGIFRIDERGRFLAVNPALARLLGHASPQAFLREGPATVKTCFMALRDWRRVLAQLARHGHLHGIETRWRHRDGGQVQLALSARRVEGSEREQEFEGSVIDIGERQARVRAELARNKAEAASQAKSQFLAVMSHEIRTPMNGILGMAQLLLRSPLNPTQRDQLAALQQSGESLLAILNDVLDLTRLEAGQMAIEGGDFDLHQVLENLATLLAPSAAEKGLSFTLAIAPTVPREVHGDARALNQVLLNLTTNAIKFTETGEVGLCVAVRQADDHGWTLAFEVSDSGIGIAPQAQARIFERFTQADPSIARRFGGTGLGLAICRHLTELQGGDIRLHSQPDQGSRFCVTLRYAVPGGAALASSAPSSSVPSSSVPSSPASASPAPASPASASPAPASPAPGIAATATPPLTVLLVEDQEINRRVTKGLLEQAGHHVLLAENGASAIAQHSAEAVDLVLLDIQLPDLDGREVAKRLRAHPDPRRAGVRIVALTAAANATAPPGRRPGPGDSYRDAGIDAVQLKPVNVEALHRELASAALGSRAAAPATPRPRALPAAPTTPAATAPPPMPTGLNDSGMDDSGLNDGGLNNSGLNDSDVIDRALLGQHRDALGAPGLTTLLAQFDDQRRARLTSLALATSREERKRLLHQLTGSLANLGLSAAAHQCRQLGSDELDPQALADLDATIDVSLAASHAAIAAIAEQKTTEQKTTEQKIADQRIAEQKIARAAD